MARRSLGSTFSLPNLFNRFWTSAVALPGSTRRSCAITHPRQINHGASCLAVTSTRQAAKLCPSTVGKHGSRLQRCRVRARHPRVRRQLVCTRDLEGKFPMRWSSGAARDQPWLVRSLPVDCRATDGTLRWGGHYEMLPVERQRKHAAMRWALQMFSRRGAALPLLDV